MATQTITIGKEGEAVAPGHFEFETQPQLQRRPWWRRLFSRMQYVRAALKG